MLPDVITHGRCQVLRLLAGSMIRELLFRGIPADDFWTNKSEASPYSHFPRGAYHDSQWVTTFETFVEELDLENILTQESVPFLF